MTDDHGSFEVLCALAASGQLTQTEAEELREHARNCDPCSSRIAQLNLVRAQLLIAHTWKEQCARAPQGMKQRFVTRAVREGVPLSHRTSRRTSDRISATHTVQPGFVAIVVLAVSMFVLAHKPTPTPRSTVDTGWRSGAPIPPSTEAHNRESQENLSKMGPGNPRGAMGRKDFQARRVPGINRRGVFVGAGAPGPNATTPANARALQKPQFAYTGYAQNGVVAVFLPPAIALPAPSRPAGNLLAECDYCRFNLSSLPVGRTFVPPAAQIPHATLAFDVSRPTPYFKIDPAAFQFIKSVGQ